MLEFSFFFCLDEMFSLQNLNAFVFTKDQKMRFSSYQILAFAASWEKFGNFYNFTEFVLYLPCNESNLTIRRSGLEYY